MIGGTCSQIAIQYSLMEAVVVHLSMIELEFKKRETQVGIPRLRNLWEQSFIRCRVLHLNPSGTPTQPSLIPSSSVQLRSLKDHGGWEYVCCLLVVIIWEIVESAYYGSVYFQTQKIPKEKNQLKALKNQVSERERAEEIHVPSALFLVFFFLFLFYLFIIFFFFLVQIVNIFISAEKLFLYLCSLKMQNLPPSPRWKGKRSWKKM